MSTPSFHQAPEEEPQISAPPQAEEEGFDPEAEAVKRRSRYIPRTVREDRVQMVETIMWVLFLIWTGVGFAVMPFNIGADFIREHIANSSLQAALLLIHQASDAVWMTLAFIVTYLTLARLEGYKTARAIALIVLIGSAAIEIIGERTDFPFGPYDYTDRLGVKLLGVLPYTIPLAWMVVVVCGRHLVMKLLPGLNRWQHALGVGFVALLTDLNLEFVAWKIRVYWVWYPHPMLAPDHGWPPLQNYISWFVLAAIFAYLAPFPGAVRRWKPSPRLITLLLLMNALFAFTLIIRATVYN